MTMTGMAGERLTWLLDTLRQPREQDDGAALGQVLAGDDPGGLLAWLTGQVEGFEVVRTECTDGSIASARLTCPNGRMWDLAVTVDGSPPHRISWVQLDRALLDGMAVREATPDDDGGILEVCRSTEIVLRDSTVTIDPGTSYFDHVRLMENPTVLVATHHGRIVAVHCGVFYPVTYGGEPQLMAQILHSRVLRDYAGLGLWSVMNRRLVDAARSHREESQRAGSRIFENGCAFFATDNDATRRLGGAQAVWSFGPYRTVLPCAELAARAPAGAGAGRAATPADASRIAGILNAAHDGEELFVPYTEASLRARLERAPDLYGWGDFLLGERAVVGTWRAGRVHTRRSAEGEDRTVRALVLDYGCEPGADDELHDLLCLAAARAAEAGMTHLSVFTSDASRSSELLRRLATSIERYEISTPYTPEPEGAAGRGLYVDQIHF